MMDIGALLIGIALLILTIPFVIGPLRSRKPLRQENQEPPGSDLKTRKDQILTSLAELDFDHQLGKVADEDYQAVRQHLMATAGEVLQQPAAPADDEIEQLIATYKQSNSGHRQCSRCGRPLRAKDRFCSGCGESRLPDTCSRCGQTFAPSDLFCTSCGRPVQNSMPRPFESA
jgi:uncharacterized membrane-anchored protein YhcB (DUF1043 family)